MKDKWHTPAHECCPPDWRGVPNWTGDYDFDASIAHCSNKSVPARLAIYLRSNRNGYGPVTAYNGYSNYDGDA